MIFPTSLAWDPAIGMHTPISVLLERCSIRRA
jgi:hypothetical protein